MTGCTGLTTPEPVYVPTPPPLRLDQQLPRMHHLDAQRIRDAAAKAKQLYPRGVAELIADVLLSAAEFGLRLTDTSKIARAVEEIMADPRLG